MSAAAKLYLAKHENVFTTNLQALMLKHQITEAELARRTHIPQPTLHKILTGKTSDPRATTLITLSDFFNISVDTLLSGNINEEKAESHTVQSLPILTWKNCVDASALTPTLTANTWNDWVVTEPISPTAFALVSKPSMEARVPKGSILIIDPNADIEDGDLLVVFYPETAEATIREISIEGPNKLLLPINPKGNPETLNDNINIIGVVVQSRFNYDK